MLIASFPLKAKQEPIGGRIGTLIDQEFRARSFSSLQRAIVRHLQHLIRFP